MLTEQEHEGIKPLITELLELQGAIYLVCDEEVAEGISLKVSKAVTLISKLVVENNNLKSNTA